MMWAQHQKQFDKFCTVLEIDMPIEPSKENLLDPLDRAILQALTLDARISWRDLAQQVGVSAPTVRDRVHRLQDSGVIEGFSLQLSPKALGYTLEAVLRLRPLPGKRHIVEDQIRATTRIIHCDKVTGEDGFVARLLLRDISELDPILESFAHMATTNTSIVKSTPVPQRSPPL